MWEQVVAAIAIVGVALAFFWLLYKLEKSDRNYTKAVESMRVVRLKDEELEKVKDHMKFLPGVGPVIVMSEEDQKKLKEARKERD